MNKFARIFAAAAIVNGFTSLPSATFAHAELVSSTPAPESTVDADNFFMIDLEFSEDLLQTAEETGSAVKLVNDSTGQEVHVDCVYVEGAHLVAQAALYESGPVNPHHHPRKYDELLQPTSRVSLQTRHLDSHKFP